MRRRVLWPLALLALLAICTQAQAQNATGEPNIAYDGSITRPTDDSPITASKGTIDDTDGVPDPFNPSWQWQVADTDGGTYTNIDADDATDATFTPRDALVGKFLQVCATFTDNGGTEETQCARAAMNVLDVNDRPMPLSSDVDVLVSATASKPYTFKEADFGFIDNDLDTKGQLKHISITSFPSVGTLRNDKLAFTGGSGDDQLRTVTRANIGNLNYYPPAGRPPKMRYAVLLFMVTDNSGAADDTTLFPGTITINLIPDHTIASGAPEVTFASGDAPTEHIAITASQGSIMDTTNTPPDSIGTIDWQWSQADSHGGNYSNIAGAAAMTATFSPGDNQAGKFLRVCASFTDNDSNSETRCLQIAEAVINVNDPPSGTVTFSGATGNGVESESISAAIQNLADPDGVVNVTHAWQWQQAAPVNDAAPAAGSDTWSDIEDATMAEFTPDQPQVGQHLRACASFTDNLGTDERLCSNPIGPIVNINDAPVATNNTVTVPNNASADSPYTFSDADFTFNDEDGDNLVSITLASFPAVGTLRVGEEVAGNIGQMVSRADIPTISYYPAANQSPNPNYASFRFNVTDDGGGPGGDTDADRTSNAATITISLAVPDPVAPTGIPAITGTAEQKATLTAGTGTVADANGINQATIAWQWQQAAPASGGGAPAADSTDWADIADATIVTFAPTQAQVARYVRVCMTFMDNHSTPTSEGPLCSDATGPIADVNDDPVAENTTYQAARDGNSNTVAIPVSAFAAAFMDADPDDSLAAVTITALPTGGTLMIGEGTAATAVTTTRPLTITDGEFDDGPLTFTIAESAGNLRQTELTFTLSDGTASSTPATLRISFGSDIEEEQVTQISAILSVAAVTNATTAISGAISSAPIALSIDGTSLAGMAQTLSRSNASTSPHQAWYLGTAPQWEHTAAHNATGNSAESLRSRLNAMANGDIALNYRAGGSAMRFWARYQSFDISGNEGEMLEYDGSGTGFYLGADRRISEHLRIGLAVSSDSADIALDLDGDMMNDEATRSVTTIYPYMHLNLSHSIQARLIAGVGSGDLEVQSTANSDAIATADLSWNMLAASLSWHRNLKGRLDARFDGSFQMSDASNESATFAESGVNLAAADTSAGEAAIDVQLRYKGANFTPFASMTARKLGGDLSQSVAMDLGLGADLTTKPAIIRLAMTSQINDTTHKRDSLSLDIATRPNPGGITASLGSRYDSITGKPRWQSTIGWQRRAAELSLDASPGDYRLRARLRW